MAFLGLGKKKTEDASMAPPPMGAPEQYPPDYGQAYQPYPQQPPQQYPPQADIAMEQQVPPDYPQQTIEPEVSKESIQEIAEAIVEEKWNEAKKELGKITEWKDQINTKITQIQEQINSLKSTFDSLHKGILGKISEYDENLTNVGTEIKAMEKVFSKVLPSLTDSVNKLQRFSTPTKKK